MRKQLRTSRARGTGSLALVLLTPVLLGGCSVMAPFQAWGLIKAADAAGTTALAYGPSKPINTVHHGDAPPRSVCIQFNRSAPLEDFVPALQQELTEQGVASRVYDSDTGQLECKVWLRYVATMEWGVPPLSNDFRAYLSSASLSLHRADGRFMASSAYAVDADYGVSKWSTTRRKLAPVVKAVITGFTS